MQTNEILYDLLKLETDEFKNPRTATGLERSAIEELANDIEERGLLYPLIVWVPHNVILGGQRRYLAIGLLYGEGRWHGPVPIRPIEAPTLEDAKATALADGLHRKNLSSYETAQALSRMGGAQKEIAKRIGKSPTYVSRLLGVWGRAIPELKEAWKNKKVPLDIARDIASAPTSEEQQALLLHYLGKSKGGRKKRGEARAGFGRPGVRQMRKLAKKRPSTAYAKGVRDAAHYFLTGETPGDPRWLDERETERSTP